MTQSLLQPWHNLAELSGGKGVRAEWNSFPEELLILTNEQASSVPCNSRSGCYMNVVRHGSGDIVGICTSEVRQCDRRKLDKADLAIYRINYQKLAAKIAEAIGFTEQLEQIKAQAALWKLGSLNPQAEHSFPIYCFLGQTCSQVEKAVNHLCLTHDSPFVMIASLKKLVNDTSLAACSRHKSKLICIEDVLNVNENGRITAKNSVQIIIASWLDTVLAKSAKPSEMNKIVIPAGVNWQNITITFQSRDIIAIKCGLEAAVNYERLHMPGMFVESHREKKPSDRWYLLMAFALWGPTLNREYLRKLFKHDDWERMRTQKSSLSKSLKQVFGLSDDPILYDRKTNEYKPVLTIRQDTNCDLNDWINDIHS